MLQESHTKKQKLYPGLTGSHIKTISILDVLREITVFLTNSAQ
jgi:hypothetical protein